MNKTKNSPNNIDDYISNCSAEVQVILKQIRETVKKAAPGAEEVISYKMPAFKNHIGFFPTAKPIEVFKDKLTAYKTSKGIIRFQLDKPLPLTLN